MCHQYIFLVPFFYSFKCFSFVDVHSCTKWCFKRKSFYILCVIFNIFLHHIYFFALYLIFSAQYFIIFCTIVYIFCTIFNFPVPYFMCFCTIFSIFSALYLIFSCSTFHIFVHHILFYCNIFSIFSSL